MRDADPSPVDPPGGWPASRPPEDLIPPGSLPRGPLLVLAPHPDDEVLATGGLILALRDRGDRVRVLVLTDGSRGGFRAERDEAYVRRRQEESRAALRALGVEDFAFLGLADGGLALAGDLPSRIASEIDSLKPAAVAAPAPFEIHPDHLAAGAALARALERSIHAPRILLTEIGAPHLANWILDITGLMERKERALACHASQLTDNDFLEKMRGLNRYRTVNCGSREIRYAEAYLEILTEDLPALVGAASRLAALAARRRPSMSWCRAGGAPGEAGR